jgi:hypothetical protein
MRMFQLFCGAPAHNDKQEVYFISFEQFIVKTRKIPANFRKHLSRGHQSIGPGDLRFFRLGGDTVNNKARPYLVAAESAVGSCAYRFRAIKARK